MLSSSEGKLSAEFDSTNRNFQFSFFKKSNNEGGRMAVCLT